MRGLPPEDVVHMLGRFDKLFEDLFLLCVQKLLVVSDDRRGVLGQAFPDIRNFFQVARDSHLFFTLAAGK